MYWQNSKNHFMMVDFITMKHKKILRIYTANYLLEIFQHIKKGNNMKLEDQILDTLKEYYRTKEKPFVGDIILSPEDYEIIKTSSNVTFTNSVWTFYGHPLLGKTDEDLGWTALEFTGWSKDHPELLTFIEEVHFRNLLYKDNK